MPLRFITSFSYIALVFVLPGFWLIRWLGNLSSSEVVSPVRAWVALGLVTMLHIAVFLALYFFFRASFRVYQNAAEDDAGIPEWLVRLRHYLSLQGYSWLNRLGALLITAMTLYYLYRRDDMVLEQIFVSGAVLIGLLDFTLLSVPLRWTDELPPPRFSFDEVPDASGQGGHKTIHLRWEPWESGELAQSLDEADFFISDSEYADARARERRPTSPINEYTHYVTHGIVTSVKQVAKYLREKSEERGLNRLQEVAATVALVRAIPYARDEETRQCPEWADYPVELLYDVAGDCEDHGILAASLLHSLGHSVALFYLELASIGHIALGYQTDNTDGMFSLTAPDGREYFYIETVPAEASLQFGDMPASFFVELRDSELVVVPETT